MFGNSKPNGATKVRIGTLIGRALLIEGEVTFTGAMRVDGTVRGAVSVPVDGEGALFIGSEGVIEGDIRATEVVVEGRVNGSVFATGTVVIGPSGRVAGEVHYGALELAQGAEVQGLLAALRQPGPERTSEAGERAVGGVSEAALAAAHGWTAR